MPSLGSEYNHIPSLNLETSDPRFDASLSLCNVEELG